MARVKLVLEYDGTNYVGWQIQQNGPSVQGRVQRALAELTGEAITVQAAGRTDSGVHARGQVIAFEAPSRLPMRAYLLGLNALLPEDIAVVTAEEVDASFDPRRWSAGKRYRYCISNRRSRSPLVRHTHWEIFLPLNIAAMREGLVHLLGRFDFSAFRAADCQAAHALREVRRAELIDVGGSRYELIIEGTAFLKHMVRNIVGSVVEVGRNRHPPGWIKEVLEGRDRTRAGPTAPAHGLVLDEVFYGVVPSERTEGGDDD